MKMIAKVWTEKRESTADGYPVAIICETDDNFVSRHKTEADAESALAKIKQAYPGEYGITSRSQRDAGWIVCVEFTDGSGYGYGDVDHPFATRAEAEAAADKDRARIGVVDQGMMASSSHSIIVLRPAGHRWTASLGVGSHTIHVRGSYATRDEAEAAARIEIERRWQDGLGYWRRLAERSGIPCTVTAQMPVASVLLPSEGESAWDAYAKRA